MADIFPLQQDVNRKAELHVYFGPQVAKCRNGVSIIWRAGRPSGWALPRVLVLSTMYIILRQSYVISKLHACTFVTCSLNVID